MDNQGMGPKLTLYTFSPDPFPDLNGSLHFKGYLIIHISQHLAIWYIWYGSWWVSTWQLAQCNAMSWLHWNKTGGCGISTLLRELLESIPTLVMNYMAIPLQCHKVLEDGNGLFGPICPYKPRCPIYTSHLSALGTYIPLNLSYPYTYPNGLLNVGIVPASATFSGSLFHIPITLCVEKVAPWVCIKSFLPYLKPMSSGYWFPYSG